MGHKSFSVHFRALGLPEEKLVNPVKLRWLSVVFGAMLGDNLTAIGSASTLVTMTITLKNDLAMSLGLFVNLAIPFAALQIVLATVYVLLVLR